jgi:hypothetical protein
MIKLHRSEIFFVAPMISHDVTFRSYGAEIISVVLSINISSLTGLKAEERYSAYPV